MVQCVRGASETGNSDIYTLFARAAAARRTPGADRHRAFVPTRRIVRRLSAAAQRGVRSSCCSPALTHKRFVQIASADTFTPLFDAGVEIFLFQPSMLHAKIMTVDGARLERRLREPERPLHRVLDEEINVVAIDPVLTAILDGHFDEDLARSERVD